MQSAPYEVIAVLKSPNFKEESNFRQINEREREFAPELEMIFSLRDKSRDFKLFKQDRPKDREVIP